MDDQSTDRESSRLLFALLNEAIEHVSKIGEAEFAAELTSLRERIANQDRQALEAVWLIFAPTCKWDDMTRETNIAHRVFEVVDAMRGSERKTNPTV
jgi:hypothetical protein